MTDTGLSERLRQQSRRSGLMVGVSMLLTIAICVGVFAASYARLGSLASDFVPQEATWIPTVDAGGTRVAQAMLTPARPPATTQTSTDANAAGNLSPTPLATATATATAFQPTHQANSATQINFRSSPGVAPDNSNRIRALTLAEPLQSLNEERTVNGEVWMKFRDEDGEEGWIRAIDAEDYVP